MRTVSDQYQGPATVPLSPDELLTIWQYLSRIPTQETESIRQKIKKHLEHRDRCSQ